MEEILHGGDIHPTHSRLSQAPCGLSQAMDQGKIGMQSTGSKQSQPHRSSPQDTPSPAHHEVTVGLSLLQEAPRAGPALLHHHSTPAVGLPKTPYSISGVANPAWVLNTSPCVIHVPLATPHLRQFTPHHQLLIFHGPWLLHRHGQTIQIPCLLNHFWSLQHCRTFFLAWGSHQHHHLALSFWWMQWESCSQTQLGPGLMSSHLCSFLFFFFFPFPCYLNDFEQESRP